MKHEWTNAMGEFALTTNHAASSYGQPVLVFEGRAYGPADEVPGTASPEAGRWVAAHQLTAHAVSNHGLPPEAHKAFCAALP